MNLRSLAFVAAAGSLALVACGNDSKTSGNTVAGTAAPGGAFNEADVAFAQGMIPHHEQAIEMADIALDPTVGAGEQVRELATRIKGGQDPEIILMTSWLLAWGQPVQMDTSEGHDMSSMEGVMSAAEMDALAATTGADFDATWLSMMIRHHDGAIAMAQTVKAAGSNADALALADQIIAAQQGEIAEMHTLLGG
jgi:uncharacterized protein (DUF305 family)